MKETIHPLSSPSSKLEFEDLLGLIPKEKKEIISHPQESPLEFEDVLGLLRKPSEKVPQIPQGVPEKIALPEHQRLEMPFPFRSVTPYGPLESVHFAGKSLIGGGLRAVKGLVGLPFDLVALFGSAKASKIASLVRYYVPQLKPETTAEDISQTISQYAIPYGLGVKIANFALQGSGAAIRFIGGLATGGLADFLVATPEEGTISDIVPLVSQYLPTTTKEGEPVLVRKAKIGLEGALIPIPIIGAAKTIETGVKIAGRIISPGRHVRKIVAKALQDQAIDIPSALQEMDRVLKTELSSGFEPTLGVTSGDPGLIGMEKFFAQKPEFYARKELNMKAISDALEEVVGKHGGNPQRARQFLEDYLETSLKGVKDPLEATQLAWNKIEADMLDDIYNFTYGRGRQVEVSAILDDTVRQELESLTARKNQLFKNIDPAYSVEIPKDRLKEAYKKLITPKSPLDSVPEKIPADLKKRLQELFRELTKEEIEAGKTEVKLTFGALQDLRPDLSEAIAKAREATGRIPATKGGVVERLAEFKRVAEAETDYLAKEGGPAAQRAKDALNFYRNEYVPRFNEGIGSLFKKAERAGQPWPASAVAGKFLFRPTGATEAAKQLKILATGPEAESAIRTYLIDTIADQIATARTNKAAVVRLNTFLNQRPTRETLSQYPAVKFEINEFHNKLRQGLESQTLLGEQIVKQKQLLAKTEKDLKRSAVSFFVDANPTNAIGEALRSADPNQAMRELVILSKSDPTGDALKGLRQSLSDYLEQNLRGTTEIGGELEVLRAKTVRLLHNPEIRQAISHLYNPDEMKILDRVASELQILNRLNKQVTTGRATAPIQEAVSSARIVIASIYGIVKGRGIFKISSWLATKFNRDPVVIAEELIKDALLNPDLGRTLLMEMTKETEPIIKQRLGSYIINNLISAREVVPASMPFIPVQPQEMKK